MNILKRLTGIATLGVLMSALTAMPATAAPIIYSAPNQATAVQNLDIAGTLYNVGFEAQTYGTFGGEEDFWTDVIDMVEATVALNAALNAARGLDRVGGRTGYPVRRRQRGFGPESSRLQ